MDDPLKSRKSKKDKKKKKSGVRTKFLIESLRQDYYALRDENDRLREIVQTNLPRETAEAILADCFDLTSPSTNVASIDELAEKMPDVNIAEDEEEEDEYWSLDDCRLATIRFRFNRTQFRRCWNMQF